MKQRTYLNDQGQSCRSIVTRSFLSCFFYLSSFTVGDSGNLLCSVAGQILERMRRAAGWGGCVYVWLRLWHLSFSLHSICGPANLCHVPFMLSVLPQVRLASLLQRGPGGTAVGSLTHPSTRAPNSPHGYREESLIKYTVFKSTLQTHRAAADRQLHLNKLPI